MILSPFWVNILFIKNHANISCEILRKYQLSGGGGTQPSPATPSRQNQKWPPEFPISGVSFIWKMY